MKQQPNPELLAAARNVLPVLSGARLVAMRELLGYTQAQVAETTGISPSALSQAERGDTTLSAVNVARISALFEVLPESLIKLPEPQVELAPQFRHLRSTPKRERLKAERFVYATARVARALQECVQFPEPFELNWPVDPDKPIVEVEDEVEEAAAQTRAVLGIQPHDPIGDRVIDLLEAGGVTVVRDPETDHDIDAYSAIVDDIPIIVLDGGTDSVWDRDNFNLAHELGHLVMHRGNQRDPGTQSVEKQANRFAGAFLGPEGGLRQQLPTDLDWGRYLQLKRDWGMSMAALTIRARDLAIIDETTYTRAMKQRSSHGWKRKEPGSNDRALPAPQFLSQAASLAKMSSEQLARRTHLPTKVVERIVGESFPSLVG
ncbi:MAG: XRE family transcriptional regulator [Acidimicrobiaceae bacterium]|nr:XRE family transcriptional regulator [Acidimicrobiaceae bacterium]